MGLTDDPSAPHATGAPDTVPVEQADTYLVLSAEERAKPFVRPVRRVYLHTTCGAVTTLASVEMAETFARKPDFYNSTYCTGCRMHRPVEEFVWLGSRGETTIDRVGS